MDTVPIVTGMTSRCLWLGIGIVSGYMLCLIPIGLWHGSLSDAWSRTWGPAV